MRWKAQDNLPLWDSCDPHPASKKSEIKGPCWNVALSILLIPFLNIFFFTILSALIALHYPDCCLQFIPLAGGSLTAF